jgi:hypothetical protein
MTSFNSSRFAARWLAVSAAVVSMGMPSERAYAQAAPESADYQDPRSGGFIDSLVRDATVGTMLRLPYFHRTKPNDNGPAAEAAAVGGWLFGETGEWRSTLSFGGALAYVAEVYGPEDGGGNSILKDPDQEGYATVGVAFARLRFGDQAITAGRISPQYAWNLDGVYRFYNRGDGAFIGRRDIRAMIPLAYEGISAAGKLANDTVRYYGGWVNKMKPLNETDFQDLAEAASLPGESDGMFYVGAQWKINDNMMLQGAHNEAEDLLNMSWIDLDMVHHFDKDRYIRLDVQYIYEDSNGNSSLGEFSMNNMAAYLEARWIPWFIPYAMLAGNSDGEELRAPFSSGPSYLSQRIGDNAEAGESTWILGSTFDFSTLGLRGLAFDVNYGERTDRHVRGETSQPLADWKELATDLIYTLGKEWGVAKGLRLRARWAQVWESGDEFSGATIADVSREQTDIRFDFQWRTEFN